MRELQVSLSKKLIHIMKMLIICAKSNIRKCGCCGKLSLFLNVGKVEEFKKCILCDANFRYEMLAEYIRNNFSLADISVLELDPNSPLRQLLQKSSTYLRTYYSKVDRAGSYRQDGTRCEDITKLSFPSNSFDLMVSSDVLEHVSDLNRAFQETHRVLKLGGTHIFTVPPRPVTVRRAEQVEESIKHLCVPEYHGDPLSPDGILVYWDFGADAEQKFSTPGLQLRIVAGPCGSDNRVIWAATKTSDLYQ